MWLIPIAAIGLIVIWVVATYNGFVTLRNRANNAWADIDVQLKRRHDLVPNLVETVKGYAGHEKGVLENVTKFRSMAMQAQSAEERAESENMLTAALKTLFAVAENYPQLKADQNFRDLQAQLAELEDQIQMARRYYNAIVRDLNTKREMFPSNIIANMFGFTQMEYFQIENEEEREPVQVKFT
ncbi:MAG: LemA family protein [Armatimonadota bacterium]|nr:LemA family protein [Armatimonadota bacterium]